MDSLTTFTVVGFTIKMQCYEITVVGRKHNKKISSLIYFPLYLCLKENTSIRRIVKYCQILPKENHNN